MDNYLNSLLSDEENEEEQRRRYVSIKLISEKARIKVRQDYDCVIAITGSEGVGKSSLAIRLGREIDDDFKMEKNILFSPIETEVKDAVTKLPKYSVIILDEAIKVLYKLNWNTKLQKMLNTLYTLCRKENKVTILCIPRLTDLSEMFRNHRVKIWIHISRRGCALIFLKNDSPFSDDTWSFRIMQKRTDKINWSAIDFNKQIGLVKKLPTFFGAFHFNDLDPKLKDRYITLRDKEGKKYRGLDFKDPEEMFKKKIEEYKSMYEKAIMVLKKTGMKTSHIAYLFNKTPTTINVIIAKNKEDMDKIDVLCKKPSKEALAKMDILGDMKRELEQEEEDVMRKMMDNTQTTTP